MAQSSTFHVSKKIGGVGRGLEDTIQAFAAKFVLNRQQGIKDKGIGCIIPTGQFIDGLNYPDRIFDMVPNRIILLTWYGKRRYVSCINALRYAPSIAKNCRVRALIDALIPLNPLS